MPDKFLKLKLARHNFPQPITCILDEVFNASDDVHEFVRLLAAYELLVKILSASCHGSLLRTQPNPRYYDRLRKYFVNKPPSMGDWVASYDEKNIRNTLRSESSQWHLNVMNEISINRDTKTDQGTSDIWRMCRVAKSNRAFIPQIPNSEKFTIADAIGTVINLRNSYAHGALTYRFANRFSTLLSDALAEIGKSLEMAQKWAFVVPRRFSPHDSSKAIYVECEQFAESPANDPLECSISGPIAWRKLHLVERKFNSLDDAICLEPFLRFEECHRGFQVLNSVDKHDGIIEYLSYRSGDFDHCLASEVWFENDKLRGDKEAFDDDDGVDTEADQEDSEKIQNSDGMKQLEAGHQQILSQTESNELLGALESGLGYKTNLNCRNRFYKVLDEKSNDEINLAFKELSKRVEEEDDSTNLLSTLGQMQREFRLYEQAVQTFRSAIGLDEQDLKSKQALGHSLLRWGDDLRRVAIQDREHSDKADELIQEAGEVLKDSLHDPPQNQYQTWHNVRSLSMLVDVNCKLSRYKEARDYCIHGLELDGSNERLIQQRDWLTQRSN